MVSVSAIVVATLVACMAVRGAAEGCYLSGEWGKMKDLRTATEGFLNKFQGKRLCRNDDCFNHISRVFDKGGGDRYRWLVQACPQEDCRDITRVLVRSSEDYFADNCLGDNADTQGGIHKNGGVQIRYDPNAV